jgi:hypothetical protein
VSTLRVPYAAYPREHPALCTLEYSASTLQVPLRVPPRVPREYPGKYPGEYPGEYPRSRPLLAGGVDVESDAPEGRLLPQPAGHSARA